VERKVSEILKEAKKLIEKEKHWTQKTYARDSQGVSISPDSIYAVSFCAIGAIMEVCETRQTAKYYRYLQKALPSDFERNLSYFNDNSSHKEVMQLFDKAIWLAEIAGD